MWGAGAIASAGARSSKCEDIDLRANRHSTQLASLEFILTVLEKGMIPIPSVSSPRGRKVKGHLLECFYCYYVVFLLYSNIN